MYDDRIIGFWDHNSQKIIFMRLDNPSDPTSFQIYTGFLFKDTTTNPLGMPLCYQTLSGSFLHQLEQEVLPLGMYTDGMRNLKFLVINKVIILVCQMI